MTSPEPTALGRDAILRTAGRIIDAEGGDALTMSRIAAELEVTQPALYRHVDGVADLWRALGLQTRAELCDRLARATVGRAGTDAIRAVASAWRQFGIDRPGCYRSTERFPVTGDVELEEAVERVIEVLVLCLRGFGLDDDAAVHGARTLRSALHGFVTFELDGAFPHPHDPDDSFDHLVDLLCLGFETQSNPKKQLPKKAA